MFMPRLCYLKLSVVLLCTSDTGRIFKIQSTVANHTTGQSAVPFPSITMVCATTFEPSSVYHYLYSTVATACLPALTLHRRRMQGHHVILLEVYQIPPRLQRSRVSQPIQVIPFLPHGPVRTLTMFPAYAPSLYPTYYTDCRKWVIYLVASKGVEGLVSPTTCQRASNQVVGTRKREGGELQGRAAAALILRLM
jgi:hypothetical protein